MTMRDKQKIGVHEGRDGLYAASAPGSLPRVDSHAALLLDFDGTLASFAPRPDAVVVAPYLAPLLLRVRSNLRGALGLVSGRPIRELDRLTSWSVVAMAGMHGLERRNGNGVVVRSSGNEGERLDQVRRALNGFQAAHPSVIVEDKGPSIALHYRLAPDEADACIVFAETHAPTSNGFEILRGNLVIEIKSAAENKGTAVRAFLSEEPFKGRRPIFVGDDLTDEDAFSEVQKHGGVAVIVGNRTPTLASHRISTVQEVHVWLNTIHG